MRIFSFTHKWNFPSNNHGQIFGISDSGVETFNGTPIKSLAREIGGADEILDQMRSLTGGGHAHVFLRRTIEGRSALYPV